MFIKVTIIAITAYHCIMHVLDQKLLIFYYDVDVYLNRTLTTFRMILKNCTELCGKFPKN